MERMSTGDEVRFQSRPDIIKVNGQPGGRTGQGHNVQGAIGDERQSTHTASTERRPRLRPVANKQGLVELDLSHHNLLQVPVYVWDQVRVEVLLLEGNRLTSLSPAVSHLHKLRVLDVQANSLTALPDTLVNCLHLQQLNLAGNQLTSLSAQLGSLRHLRRLNASHNQLTSLPNELASLMALRRLDISANGLWHLPQSLKELHHLHQLNLSDNLFDQLPITVCHFKQLQTLQMRNNKLVNLPDNMEQLSKLTTLDLAGNKFKSVPAVVCKLTALAHLDISENKLKNLPARMARLTKLSSLLLHDNQLSGFLHDLPGLQHLNLANNHMRHFSVAKMKKLVRLSAGCNQLEDMPQGVFNCRGLTELRLAHNSISDLSQEVSQLKKLHLLDLSYNEITTLPQSMHELLPSLQVFNISGNPLDPHSGRGPYKQAQESGRVRSAPTVRGGHPESDNDRDAVSVSGSRYKKKPVYSNPLSKWKNKFKSQRKNKPGYLRQTDVTDGQVDMTPRSTLRSAHRGLSDERLPVSHITDTHSQHTSRTSRRFMNGTPSVSINMVNALGTSEIFYPMEDVHASMRDMTTRSGTESYTETWLADRHKPAGVSAKSTAVTINDDVGEQLSLGDDDFEYQPTTVTDHRLIGVCCEVEAMLNEELLKPVSNTNRLPWHGSQQRMLRSGSGSAPHSQHTSGPLRGDVHRNDYKWTVEETDTSLPTSLPRSPNSAASMLRDDDSLSRETSLRTRRLRAESHRVTSEGGEFTFSSDPNVKLQIPPKAVNIPVNITMQLELIHPSTLGAIQQRVNTPAMSNLQSIGSLLHLSPKTPVAFNEPISITLPAPPAARGKLHLLTVLENGQCEPCAAAFTHHNAYVTMQVWHCSGKVAVFTKSESPNKACKSMQAFLKQV